MFDAKRKINAERTQKTEELLAEQKKTARLQRFFLGAVSTALIVASMLGLVSGGILFENLTTYIFMIGGILFFIITVLLLWHGYKHDTKDSNLGTPVLSS